jgi:ArsR family transcriptional regulator
MTVDERRQKEWVEVFSALASGTRLRIVMMVFARQMECQEILSKLNLSQPAVSYHLGKLEHAGVLIKERNGSRNCYKLGESISKLIGIVEKQGVR